jgi:malate synthase
LIRTCHKRGVHAMGGMAAQIPIKNDPAASEAALAKVRADKEREVGDGHDGTWVAHPGLVGLAKEIFDKGMPEENQIGRAPEELEIGAADLLKPAEGTITEQGLRTNLSVGMQYLAAWLGGNGCVPLYNLMEDAATAEISRAQVWQWVRHGAALSDGRKVTAALAKGLLKEEMEKLGTTGRLKEAADLFERISTEERFTDFLTLPAYDRLD